MQRYARVPLPILMILAFGIAASWGAGRQRPRTPRGWRRGSPPVLTRAGNDHPGGGIPRGGSGTGSTWVTDGLYQAMSLVTGEGVILVDAPPTWVATVRRSPA